MYIKINIITAFLFLIYISAYTQTNKGGPTQTIRGTVTDRASGHPLSYVTVGITGLAGHATTTDNDGNFRLENVPVGRHNIKATSVGFEPSIFREILVSSSKEVFLEITLRENVEELEEVTVHPQVNKEQPLNKMALSGARMLSVEEASRYAGGFDDPARLVTSFAGVSTAVSNNGISIHGNAPTLLQWRLEDVEIPNPNHFADIPTLGGGILSSLSNHVLGNSDFFTGGFPAEYNNAISGVFDMKLRNGNNQKYENTIQVGLMGIDVASEGPLSKKHKASYIFNYRYSTTGLLTHIDPNMDIGGVLDYQDLNFKINIPTNKAGTFSIWGTSLIDKVKADFEYDSSKWEYLTDRYNSNAKQYVAAGGIAHRYFFQNGGLLKTTLVSTFYLNKVDEDSYDTELNASPLSTLRSKNTNLVLTSSYNRKFSTKFTNQTGFTYTKMFYDMSMDLAPYETESLETISKGKGNTDLISVYNSSSYNINDELTLNLGLSSQFLTLNNHWTLEPRAGIKWQATPRTSYAFSYGLHSRMEKMDVYFVKTQSTGSESVNKDLDFTKTHHLMFTFQHKLSDHLNLKIEPYFQYLYDVPVIADSTFSILNRTRFYVEDPLVNKGKGRNIGVDITLERYLNKGFYYMITASVFGSKYQGGDGIWHNSRFNRNFIVNTLIGKEWMIGRNKQHILSANLKLTLQGGDRYSPIDEAATINHPDKEVVYDETRPYSKQFSPMFIANATVSYKMNMKKTSHEIAVKAINLTGCKEYYGYAYNLQTGIIEPNRNNTTLTNVSYKIEF